MIRTVAIVLVIVAALQLIALAYSSVSGPRKADVEELPIAWPPAEELLTRWCSSGSRSASVETAMISCEGECYALLRYWVFFPADVEIRREIPVKIMEGDEVILEKDVTFYKRVMDMYIHTPVLLLRMPEGTAVKVANESVEIPGCSKHRLVPPQVIYTKGIFTSWKQPVQGLKYIRLMDGVYALNWAGTAKLSCGTLSFSLKELGENELAIVSVKKGGCDVEVAGRRAHLEG
ncbi:MAG: hypothetical protein QI199_04990 [Candidatus Korarchaeota archaeon]|nr:hypothetical protein [Candidatus Korarchaeota archaeon]